MEVTAKAEIRVSEIPLHHRRLSEINVQYAFGWSVGDTPALFVATEGEEGRQGVNTVESKAPRTAKVVTPCRVFRTAAGPLSTRQAAANDGA